jgi:hypothetical protein
MRLYPITIRARREVTERFSQLWESVHYADNVRDVEDPNDRASLVRIIGATTIDVMRREGKWLIYLTVSPRIHHNWEIVFRLCCFDHQGRNAGIVGAGCTDYAGYRRHLLCRHPTMAFLEDRSAASTKTVADDLLQVRALNTYTPLEHRYSYVRPFIAQLSF